MSRDDAWLLDMLTYARWARQRVLGITREQFLADDDKSLAVTYLFMIVGEAAAQVTDATRRTFPSLPWSQIIGTRNRIVHHYFKVDLDIIWGIVVNDLPALTLELETAVPPDAAH